MILFVFETSLRFKGIGFPTGRVFMLIGLLMLTYAVFSERFISELYYVSRIFFWIIGSFFIYRMTLFGIITDKLLVKAIGCIVLLSSILTTTFILNPAEEATQNVGIYVIVWCLPFIMIIEKKTLKRFLMGIACFAIVISMKRGAIIAMLAAIGSYSFFYFQMKKNIRAAIGSIVMIVISILLLVTTLYILNQVKPEFVSDRFKEFSSFEDTEKLGSGRGRLYTLLAEAYFNSKDSNLLNFFFGFGSRSTQELTAWYYGTPFSEAVYAHSDWLQFMHDYGLLGIFMIILLHISIINLIRKCYLLRHPLTAPLVMCYSTMFLKNIYSGLLFFPDSIYFSMFIAYVCAILKKNYEIEPKFPEHS